METDAKKSKWLCSPNYPRPAIWYHYSHSPAEHFALAGYEYLARLADTSSAPDDETLDRVPEAYQRWIDRYVLDRLRCTEPPKQRKKKKAPSDEPAEEVPASIAGIDITWHRELPRLKVWAGQMSLATIIAPRLIAIQSDDATRQSLFDFRIAMRDAKSNVPIGASGLDPRSIVDARAAGFSPSDLSIAVAQYPAVDLLAIIGLQVSPIMRISWNEYAYTGAPNSWDTQDAWSFRLVAREGGYMRNFSMATKWTSDNLALPQPTDKPIRQHVIELANKKEMTAYAIAHATKRGCECAVSEDHIKRYLDGDADMTSEKVDAVLGVLGVSKK